MSRVVAGAGNAATGRGTVIGVFGRGCDVTSNSLRRATGKTMLLALADQSTGRIISSTAIDRALDTRDPMRTLRYDADEPDETVEVIARGAPGAEIVFIDLPEPARLGDIRDGIELLSNLASGRPWVAHLDIRRDATPTLDVMLAELGRGLGRSIVCRSPRLASTIARMYEAARRPLSGADIRSALRADDPVSDVRLPATAVAPELIDLVEDVPGLIPVHRLVFSGGIRLTPVNSLQTWVGGQDLAPQYTRLILNSLLPTSSVTEDLVTEMTPLVRAAKWHGVDVKRKATDKQKVRSITMQPTLAFAFMAWLERVDKPPTLTVDEIGRVERAVAISFLWNRLGENLKELYPWMTEQMLAAFAWRRRRYVDDLHAAIGSGKKPVFGLSADRTGWNQWRVLVLEAFKQNDPRLLPWLFRGVLAEPVHDAIQALSDAWNEAVGPLEAIREDPSLVKTRGYKMLWKTASGAKADSKTPIDTSYMNRFFTYAWQRRSGWAKDAINPDGGESRRKLIDGFARYAGVAANEAPTGQDGGLAYSPGTANAPPLPSSLATSPAIAAPLYMVPVGADVRANMVLQFPDVFEAFQRFGYRWELVKLPTKTIDEAIRRGNDLGFEATDSEAPGLGTTLGNQLDRRYGYAKEDVSRVFQTLDGWLGSAGVGASLIVGVGAIAGFIGEVISSVIEWLTAKQNEKRVTLTETGLFLLRCIATPVTSDDADRIRPPSAAYLPLWVQSVEEVAENQALHLQMSRMISKPLLLAKLKAALKKTTDPKEKEELEAKIKELELEIRGSVDGVLENAYQTLRKYIADLKKQDSPHWADKKQTEKALKEASQAEDALLKRLMNRARWRAKLDPDAPHPDQMTRLRGAMVTDTGDVVELVADAYLHPKTGEYYVFDSTKPHSGMGRAKDADPSIAIRKALKSTLDSSDHGYGRGHVSFFVTIDGVSYKQSFRTSPDLEGVLIHSFENTVQLATAVALCVVVATGGAAGVAFLLPLAIVGAVPSLYRILKKVKDGELASTFDMATLLDIVNVIGSLAGLGQAVAGGLKLINLSQGFMIMGLGADAASGLLMTADIANQIAACANIQPPAARHAQLVQIMGGAFMQLGMVTLGKAAGRYAEKVRLEALGSAKPVLERVPFETSQRLKALVSADVPVFIDPDAPTAQATIRIDLDGYGLPSNLRVVVPDVTVPVDDVARPVRSHLRIDELAGAVRKLSDRVESIKVGVKTPPATSRAGEAIKVIEGAPKRLSELADGLQNKTIEPDAVDAKLDVVRADLERAQLAIAELRGGKKFVDAQKPTEARAVAANYDKAPPGHYVIEPEPGVFELRRIADATEKPHHYDARKRAVPGEAPLPKPKAEEPPRPPTKPKVEPPTKPKVDEPPTKPKVDEPPKPPPPEPPPPTPAKPSRKTAYDPAVTGAAAGERLGGAVRFEKSKHPGIRIRRSADGGFTILVPTRRKVSHADVMAAVEERLRLPERPVAPSGDPRSRKVKGRKAPWSGNEEAQWRGYPAPMENHHYVWRGKDIEHIKRPGKRSEGKSYRYDPKRDGFKKRKTTEPYVFVAGDDPMEILGANSPGEPFALWVETVTGENGVLVRMLGHEPGVGLQRPGNNGPITREWIRGQMGDPTGKTTGQILDQIRRHVQPQLDKLIRDVPTLRKRTQYDRFWQRARTILGNDAAADLAVSHRALLDITSEPRGGRHAEGLHPIDAGNMASDWFYEKVAPKDTVREVSVGNDVMKAMNLDPEDGVPRLDGVVVSAAKGSEVKHGRSQIINPDPVFGARNRRQWDVFRRLAGALIKNKKLPDGEILINAMEYAMTHPEGVLANADWIAEQLLSRHSNSDFMLFDHERGVKTWTSADAKARTRQGLSAMDLAAEIRAFINGDAGVQL